MNVRESDGLPTEADIKCTHLDAPNRQQILVQPDTAGDQVNDSAVVRTLAENIQAR